MCDVIIMEVFVLIVKYTVSNIALKPCWIYSKHAEEILRIISEISSINNRKAILRTI